MAVGLFIRTTKIFTSKLIIKIAMIGSSVISMMLILIDLERMRIAATEGKQ